MSEHFSSLTRVKPDKRTSDVFDQLRAYESRNITFIEPDDSWPVVWKRARGVRVWDIAGQSYIDLTAAFGVAAAGHANRFVVRAGQRQMGQLLHAMSDVHPHSLKAQLAKILSRLTFERWSRDQPSEPGADRRPPETGKTIFASAGFEAVEAALKTALLATQKPGVIAFGNAYHGLGYGALNVTQRDHFKARFKAQLGRFTHVLPFPTELTQLKDFDAAARRIFQKHAIGAVIIEPVQVRGGVNVAPGPFLPLLRGLCDEFSSLLILDEIYTGFGRTGRWFACEHSGVKPDLVCLGKAMTGGFPLSACVGAARIMDTAWPPATGDPIHTSTFLGHPVGCAMALANIQELTSRRLVDRSARLGKYFADRLAGLADMKYQSEITVRTRAVGLLGGVEMLENNGMPASEAALRLVKRMLTKGFVVLPDGPFGNVISLTPPLTISRSELSLAFNAMVECLQE